MVEHAAVNRVVEGSSPSSGAIFFPTRHPGVLIGIRLDCSAILPVPSITGWFPGLHPSASTPFQGCQVRAASSRLARAHTKIFSASGAGWAARSMAATVSASAWRWGMSGAPQAGARTPVGPPPLAAENPRSSSRSNPSRPCTRAPRSASSLVKSSPTGPCPATSTRSPGRRFSRRTLFEHGVDRIEHGALLESVPRRDGHDARENELHHPHVCRVAAARRLETRCEARALAGGALRKRPGAGRRGSPGWAHDDATSPAVPRESPAPAPSRAVRARRCVAPAPSRCGCRSSRATPRPASFSECAPSAVQTWVDCGISPPKPPRKCSSSAATAAANHHSRPRHEKPSPAACNAWFASAIRAASSAVIAPVTNRR